MLNQSDRKFFRYLVGDFALDDFKLRWRELPYLKRNVESVLKSHQRRVSTQVNSTRPSEPSLATNLGAEGSTIEEILVRGSTDNSHSAVDNAEVGDVTLLPVVLSQPPIMSHTMTASDQRGNNNNRTRSLRSLRDKKLSTGADSVLVIDLSNIRKKLNFKTNAPDEADRPAKRQKREAVRCKCHLTIWDNRREAPSIIPKAFTRDCHVTATEAASEGFFVEVELDSPFLIKSEDLMFTYRTKNGLTTGIIDNYFMEIKIIPCRATTRWPPIPILGKSDGDQFRELKEDSGELQGSVVARYMHLPQAPAADVPLSVFFLHEGRTYRTKYGLSVVSNWSTTADAVSRPSNGIDLDSFKEPEPLPSSVVETPRNDHTQNIKQAAAIRMPKHHLPSSTDPIIDVHYAFAYGPNKISSQVDEKLRSCFVTGYRCPLCAMWKTTKLTNLQFHLTTCHIKYTWSVHQTGWNPTGEVSTCVEIEVGLAAPTKREDAQDTSRAFEWHAPDKPFDLRTYLMGDLSWLGMPEKQISTSKKALEQTSKVEATLPPTRSLDFRLSQRKKYPAIRLQSTSTTGKPVYTSVSHRPVSPSEEPRSETDDEFDNDWRIQEHMMRLDNAAKKEGWNSHERELRKRWDKHRMEEQLEHPRYLANSLLRFVRKNRRWLSRGGDTSLKSFLDFLQRMKDVRAIDDAVIFDVNEVLFDISATRPSTGINIMPSIGITNPISRHGIFSPVLTNGIPSPGMAEAQEQESELQRALRPNTLLTPKKRTASPVASSSWELSPSKHAEAPATQAVHDSCGICQSRIKRVVRHAVFCTNRTCVTATVMYHRNCVDGISSKGKGKAIDFKTWICSACEKLKQSDQAHSPAKPPEGGVPARDGQGHEKAEHPKPYHEEAEKRLPTPESLMRHTDSNTTEEEKSEQVMSAQKRPEQAMLKKPPQTLKDTYMQQIEDGRNLERDVHKTPFTTAETEGDATQRMAQIEARYGLLRQAWRVPRMPPRQRELAQEDKVYQLKVAQRQKDATQDVFGALRHDVSFERSTELLKQKAQKAERGSPTTSEISREAERQTRRVKHALGDLGTATGVRYGRLA